MLKNINPTKFVLVEIVFCTFQVVRPEAYILFYKKSGADVESPEETLRKLQQLMKQPPVAPSRSTSLVF